MTKKVEVYDSYYRKMVELSDKDTTYYHLLKKIRTVMRKLSSWEYTFTSSLLGNASRGFSTSQREVLDNLDKKYFPKPKEEDEEESS